eukprot:gene2856-biopygen2561
MRANHGLAQRHSPLCFFDEIDAALDSAHVKKVASVLRRVAHGERLRGDSSEGEVATPQFLCISLRHQMYHWCWEGAFAIQ